MDWCSPATGLQWDIELLASQDWQGLGIDEAQAIKNPGAKQAGGARTRPFPQVFPHRLTGTPVENRVSEPGP